MATLRPSSSPATATAAASFAPSSCAAPTNAPRRPQNCARVRSCRRTTPADAAAVSTTATSDPQWPSDERWLPCHTTASLEIEHAPIGDLYDAYCDLTRMTEWAPILQSVT